MFDDIPAIRKNLRFLYVSQISNRMDWSEGKTEKLIEEEIEEKITEFVKSFDDLAKVAKAKALAELNNPVKHFLDQ